MPPDPSHRAPLVEVRMDDLALLIVAWQRSRGLAADSQIDARDVNDAVWRACDAIVNTCIKERAHAPE